MIYGLMHHLHVMLAATVNLELRDDRVPFDFAP